MLALCMKQVYPVSKTVDHNDTYHGTRVADPYRWLEQPAHTPDVAAWISAQNQLTFDFLASIPGRPQIEARLTELWDYPKQGAPFKKGTRYFQFRNSGLQNQNVLYLMSSPTDAGQVLLDPNTLSDDGTTSLNSYSLTQDGALLAYAVSQSGSDWVTWQVRDVATGEDLTDVLEWSRFSTATWLPDNSGFFYQVYPEPEQGEEFTASVSHPELLFHKLGTPQASDEVVYKRPDEPQWGFHTALSDDERYLILYITHGTERRNLLYYRPLAGGDFVPLIDRWEAEYQFLGNDGDVFYLQTDLHADRKRVVAIDINAPETANWLEVIAEAEDTLQTCKLIQDEFLCLYMHHASHILKRIGTDGTPKGSIELPTLGTVLGLNAERTDNTLFYSFTSFLYPTLTFSYDLGSATTHQLDTAAIDFDASPYVTRQVFVDSKDGTAVPLFLVHRKDIQLDRTNPTLLYGYGGFDISLTPSFSVGRLVWLELGGVLAVANLRGGGEYGKAWHKAGTKERKQNVFDDFIACAEWLITSGLSSSQKLAIQGGSNGGLLVGAAMTQRPELFGAALPAVGVLDMLRYHQFTIGWAWASDYGSADDAEAFSYLIGYSPLHNLKEGTAYPATLITTGDHDDRVVPAHSFKFAAALQKAQAGDAPTLIRIQTKAGHGMGKPTTMLIAEQADIWAFLTKVLAMDVHL